MIIASSQKIIYKVAKSFYKKLSNKYQEKFLQNISHKISLSQDEAVLDCKNHERDLFRNYANDKNYFCILSVGACGSIWLSSILNDNPEITCSVGNDHPSASVSYTDHKKTLETAKRIIDSIVDAGDVEYGAHFSTDGQFISEISVENYRDYMYPFVYGVGNIIKNSLEKRGININISARFNMITSFPYFLRELEVLFPKSSYYGNIHGLTCSQVAALISAKNKLLDQVVFVDLIRNPINSLEAIISGRRKLYEIDLIEKANVDNSIINKKEEAQFLKDTFGVNFDDPENRIRFYCNYSLLGEGWTKYCSDDLKSLKVPRVAFERIKNEPEYLAWLISYLTKGKLSVSKSYLDSIYKDNDVLENCGRVGSNKTAPKSSREQWEEWPEWQKKVFQDQCNAYSLYDLYFQYSYDLSFVKNHG